MAELPQAMPNRPVEIIAKVFAVLPGFGVGGQQYFVICFGRQTHKSLSYDILHTKSSKPDRQGLALCSAHQRMIEPMPRLGRIV